MSITVLSGGVGGAKLVLGLAQILQPDALNVIVNTGDDFEHFGLPVCTDLDTLMYTLAGRANPDTGWGLADESWDFMAAVEALGGDAWFRLGDRDLATHARRLELRRSGLRLSEVTQTLFREAGVRVNVWPMSDQPVRTKIITSSEEIDFQDYFVRRRAEPVATGFAYRGADTAPASPEALAALNAADLEAVIIAPSNPWLSVDPILSLRDISSALDSTTAPVVAVSPVVAGRALKGPTAKLMAELGVDVSVLGIAQHYAARIDGLIIDERDAGYAAELEALGLRVGITQTIMTTLDDKRRLGAYALGFAATLTHGRTA